MKPKLVVVRYCVGVDLFGQPIYVYHNVFINKFTKNFKNERKNSNQ
jgi:hypothetical protein